MADIERQPPLAYYPWDPLAGLMHGPWLEPRADIFRDGAMLDPSQVIDLRRGWFPTSLHPFSEQPLEPMFGPQVIPPGWSREPTPDGRPTITPPEGAPVDRSIPNWPLPEPRQPHQYEDGSWERVDPRYLLDDDPSARFMETLLLLLDALRPRQPDMGSMQAPLPPAPPMAAPSSPPPSIAPMVAAALPMAAPAPPPPPPMIAPVDPRIANPAAQIRGY